VRQAADEIAFRNGLAATPDNSTPIIAESFGGRLTAYDIVTDGRLSNRACGRGAHRRDLPPHRGRVWSPGWIDGKLLEPPVSVDHHVMGRRPGESG
jgi:hypothetical protein